MSHHMEYDGIMQSFCMASTFFNCPYLSDVMKKGFYRPTRFSSAMVDYVGNNVDDNGKGDDLERTKGCIIISS